MHQHVFKVMKMAFKEIPTPERQTERACVLWGTFMEPFFGVHSHKREDWKLEQSSRR